MGEAPHEEFGRGFAGRCVLYHGEDAGHGRLSGGTGDTQAYRAPRGDHAGHHLAARVDGAGLGLAREGGGVEGGGRANECAVEGDTFARPHLYGLSYGDVLGGGVADGAVGGHKACVVGAQGHQTAYIVAGAVDGPVLQGLADLIEQHDGHSLGIFADGEGTHGSDAHERMLAEGVALCGVLYGLAHHAEAYGQKGGDIPYGFAPALPQVGNGGG